MSNNQLELFSDFEAFRNFILSKRNKKRLHSLSENQLQVLLKEIYPESHPVNESNINGGRADLIFYFDSIGHSIHFEIFTSKSTVENDLRILEQSKSDIKVAILIDDKIDPLVSKKYFRKKPYNQFPNFNLSQIFMENKINDFKSNIINLIKKFEIKPNSEIASKRNILMKCYEALLNICNKYFEYYNQKSENAENFLKKDLLEIVSSLNILKEFKTELYNLNISYCELFQKDNPNPYFKFIYIEKEIRIYMQMEYIDPINICIEKNGIKVQNINDINQILIKIKNKINF